MTQRTALVTGAAGFLGRHMVNELRANGWYVNDGWDLEFGRDAMDYFAGPYNYGRESNDEPCYDLVVHAAYHVGGRAGIEGANRNFPRNVALDGAMFDWAVRTKQKRVLYFSSSAAYPVRLQTQEYLDHLEMIHRKATPSLLSEHHINLGQWSKTGDFSPDAGYGWAKLTGEMMAADARRAGLAVTVVRPFSGYGSDQSPDYPFPSIVDRAISGQHYVWGPPEQTRDWIHVRDVVGAALAVAESGTEEPVNLCTGIATTMDDLLREAVRQLHSAQSDNYPHVDEIDIKHVLDAPTGVLHRVGDPTRMLQYYTPQVTLEHGVRAMLVRRGVIK